MLGGVILFTLLSSSIMDITLDMSLNNDDKKMKVVDSLVNKYNFIGNTKRALN